MANYSGDKKRRLGFLKNKNFKNADFPTAYINLTNCRIDTTSIGGCKNEKKDDTDCCSSCYINNACD